MDRDTTPFDSVAALDRVHRAAAVLGLCYLTNLLALFMRVSSLDSPQRQGHSRLIQVTPGVPLAK
ncbi:hypothetical protein BDV93DRAFT_565357 [Ceratobasidium sp. AG-I]|nr:hypothetical protein BDV93DRAFT_565357 [Ceratobasidium sp. AG-I]